ncbi:PREDICTED: DNA dC-_dU-editing enzyme APOBEC-3H [Colobus angolensis palliatus]|uniref:DNA dC->dU-editing enzyme APOBEC-3H n=1 Tax=Colobus angolensis palliatus TaxID=336983 RepID=UPI0005F54CCD|nr:PREDICTED: DNA dC->dU-editing enzyme APOBEC-3H [Colobus angolensis palliatus]
MALLRAETFSLQFNNKRRVSKPYYPRKALLCYQLTPQNGSTPTRGYLKNKQSRSVDVLENGLRSLQLGPVTPSSSRRNSR